MMQSKKLYPATYVGQISLLKGKTALIRLDEENKEKVLAQFDDLGLRYHGVGLAFNWHRFDRKDFKFRKGVKVNDSRYSGDSSSG